MMEVEKQRSERRKKVARVEVYSSERVQTEN